MEQGFDSLSRLTADTEDVRAARARYLGLRTHIDPVVRGADRIELVVTATRVNRSGQHREVLVIVTDSIVIVSGTRRRGVTGARSVSEIFPRPGLTVLPTTVGERRAVELHADGRRLRLILPNMILEASIIALGGRDAR
jgi:hypothetical protein